MSEFSKLIDRLGVELSEAIETGKLEEIIDVFSALSEAASGFLKSEGTIEVMDIWKVADAKFNLVKLLDDAIKLKGVLTPLELLDSKFIRLAIEQGLVPWAQKHADALSK